MQRSDLRRRWGYSVWDELRNGLARDGVCVLANYLNAEIVNPLAAAFEEAEPATSSETNGTSATLVKRGVVFARRNLLSLQFVQQFVHSPPVQDMVGKIAPGAVAVRGILFDKTGDANWTVPWHQDRSIAVQERLEVPGFGPWSRKAGVVHVQPSVEILSHMLTLRFSLDPCDADNGPLRAIPGTHKTIMSQAEIDSAVEHEQEVLCTTAPGGVVIMRPLLLHASSPAKRASRRRMLHVEFGPRDLGAGLHWALA